MITYGAERKLLVVTRGHPFDHGAFFGMLESMQNVAWCHVEHPAAPVLFNPERSADFAAFLCYDMPGLSFRPGEHSGFRGVDYVAPPEFLIEGMEALLQAGKPFIFLHHALAGWPSWDRYEQIVGGRFRYKRDAARELMDSGYRHAVRHHVEVVCDHPITRGLGAGFEIEDELYLVDIDEADKIPLLRSIHDFSSEGFYSAHEAVMNNRLSCNAGWHRPTGSNLIAWAKRSGNSPVVYIQCGDGPAAYENSSFRLLLQNTIDWVTARQLAFGLPDPERCAETVTSAQRRRQPRPGFEVVVLFNIKHRITVLGVRRRPRSMCIPGLFAQICSPRPQGRREIASYPVLSHRTVVAANPGELPVNTCPVSSVISLSGGR